MTDLIISIGTLGNYQILEQCLQSVLRQSTSSLNYQAWIIFNGSVDDGFTERIEKEFPQVTLIKRIGPLGYCATHNLVLNNACARYILLLDDDTIVPDGTLTTMVAFMDANPTVGIAGCKTLNPDGTFQKSYGMLPSLRTELAAAFLPAAFWPHHLYRNLLTPIEVEWLNGSFLLVRTSALQQVGGLDEHYYTYVCEPDWCFRFKRAGWKVMFAPQVAIVHFGGEHSIITTDKKYVNIIRYYTNRYYFFHRHYGCASLFLLRPIMIIGALLRIGYFLPKFFFTTSDQTLARTRLRALLKIIRLSLSRKPYNLPPDLQIGGAVPSKAPL
jgi:GT2 family glycosyltransferase